MPATSKAQFRFMQGVAHGSIKKPGLSTSQAQEFVSATPSYKALPEKKNQAFHKLLNHFMGNKNAR